MRTNMEKRGQQKGSGVKLKKDRKGGEEHKPNVRPRTSVEPEKSQPSSRPVSNGFRHGGLTKTK